MPTYEFKCTQCGAELVDSLPMDLCSDAAAFPVHCGKPTKREYRTAPMVSVSSVSGVLKPWELDGDDQFRNVFGEDPGGDATDLN